MQRIIIITFLAFCFFIPRAYPQTESLDFQSKKHHQLVEQLKQLTSGQVKIHIHTKTGKVTYIGTDPTSPIPQPFQLSRGTTPEEAARGFLSVYGSVFGLKDQKSELRTARTKAADRGRNFIRFQQLYSSIPVFGAESVVQTDSSNNIISVYAIILPDIEVDTYPTIDPDTAKKRAVEAFLRAYGKEYDVNTCSLRISEPELWIYNPFLVGIEDRTAYLVWRLEIIPLQVSPINELVLVDAHSGRVLLHFNQNPTALHRQVYDHNNVPGKTLPGDLMRSEGQGATGIADVDNAYDYTGDTYNFYMNYHSRDSINDAGMPLISTTRYCPSSSLCPYPNAFWSGSQMVYGQGYASADDVVGHEITHGVTQFESGLIYLNQSGAINEALSDIFGEFVDLTNGRGNDSSGVRWLIAEDLPVGAFRSMSDPLSFGHPDKISSSLYYCGLFDNGGVHINSGVANKAAYLMTDGGTFNGITVAGLGIAKVSKIFYEAQTNLLTTATDYEDLFDLIQQACQNLIGTNGITAYDCEQVANALSATEMNQPISCSNLLVNPGFESGSSGWTISSKTAHPIIQNDPTNARDGSWLAVLGLDNDAKDLLYQDVTIPSNITRVYLQFDWRVVTQETGGARDFMYVQVRNPTDNTVLQPIVSMSNLDSRGWVTSYKFDLTSFKGRMIRITFFAVNNSTLPTTFFIDSTKLYANVIETPPAAPLISPSGYSNDKPTFTWSAVSSASRYLLQVDDSTGTRIRQWYPSFAAGCGSGSGTCSVTPGIVLAPGTGSWKVLTKNRGGLGPWSESMPFVVRIKVKSFAINNGAEKTAKGRVILNNTTTDTPTHYMASEDPMFADAIWQPYSTAPNFYLSTGDGLKTVYLKVKNSLGESDAKSDTILALKPAIDYFRINDGATGTANSMVTLNNLALYKPTHYMASEDPNFGDATWQPYSSAPTFTLSPGAGTKTVYFKVKNYFAESTVASDTILAKSPVVTSFAINNGASNTAKGTVTLDNTATGKPTHYMASEDPNFGDATWQPYSSSPSFTLSPGTGTKTVYFKVKNYYDESSAVSDSIKSLVP